MQMLSVYHYAADESFYQDPIPSLPDITYIMADDLTDDMDMRTGELLPSCPDNRSNLYVLVTPENGTLSIDTNPELGSEPAKLELNTAGWQKVDFTYKGHVKTLAVYSAYYDDRLPTPVVRVIAMLPLKVPPLKCTVSTRTSDGKMVALITREASAHGSRYWALQTQRFT
jgi:hypothetical protein